MWSEEVTPPLNGWRSRGHDSARNPAPMVNPVIGSMMALEGMVHPMTAEKRAKDLLLGKEGGAEGGVSFAGVLFVLVAAGAVMSWWRKNKKKKNGGRM